MSIIGDIIVSLIRFIKCLCQLVILFLQAGDILFLLEEFLGNIFIVDKTFIVFFLKFRDFEGFELYFLLEMILHFHLFSHLVLPSIDFLLKGWIEFLNCFELAF